MLFPFKVIPTESCYIRRRATSNWCGICYFWRAVLSYNISLGTWSMYFNFTCCFSKTPRANLAVSVES